MPFYGPEKSGHPGVSVSRSRQLSGSKSRKLESLVMGAYIRSSGLADKNCVTVSQEESDVSQVRVAVRGGPLASLPNPHIMLV